MGIIQTLKASFKKGRDQTLGVDLGHHSTKIIKMNHQEGQIDFCGMITAPYSKESFFQDLNGYLKDNGLIGLDAAVCFDDPSIKIRKVELPRMPEGDLKEAIKWKMRDVVEGDIEDFTVRHSILKEVMHADAPQMVTVAYAVRSSTVFKLRHELTKSGLTLKLMEPSAVSLAAAVEAVCPSTTQWVAAIDLGYSRSVIVILGEEKLYFSRPLAGIALENKIEGPLFNQKLAAEIQNALDTFAVTFRDEKIKHLLLSGGGAMRPGLKEYLSTNLAIETEIMNRSIGLKVVHAKAPLLKEAPSLFAQALSLTQASYD